MGKPWMDVIGIGEDGVDGLAPQARRVLEQAEVIIGGDRHHQLSENGDAKRIKGRRPLDAFSIPPTTTIPIGRRLSAPAPKPMAMGKIPETVDTAVIRMGRSRTVPE